MKEFQKSKTTYLLLLTPLIGSVLFAILYYTATLYYPGGTHLQKGAHGFSWQQNYWCNLLDEYALNGQVNPARPIAFAAMLVLDIALISFWFTFPQFVNFKAGERRLIQASGFLSMLISAFVFTNLHDTIINVAGAFGLIALGGTIIGLRRLKWKALYYMGWWVVALIALNNLLFYKKNLMYYLPVVQKITFVYFLVWICLISFRLMSKTNINTTMANS